MQKVPREGAEGRCRVLRKNRSIVVTNEDLYVKAFEAISELFSDHSVPQSRCRENLQALHSEIQTMLDCLDDDA